MPVLARLVAEYGVPASNVTILLVWCGTALALPAAVAGVVEYSRRSSVADALAIRHLQLVLAAFTAFVMLGLLLSQPGDLSLPTGTRRIVAGLGLALLLAAGHVGGKVVGARYRDGSD